MQSILCKIRSVTAPLLRKEHTFEAVRSAKNRDYKWYINMLRSVGVGVEIRGTSLAGLQLRSRRPQDSVPQTRCSDSASPLDSLPRGLCQPGMLRQDSIAQEKHRRHERVAAAVGLADLLAGWALAGDQHGGHPVGEFADPKCFNQGFQHRHQIW